MKRTPHDFIRRHRRKTAHRNAGPEMHQAMHSLPGYFRALLLDLNERPMTFEELLEAVRHIEMRMSSRRRNKFGPLDVKRDIDSAILCNVLEMKENRYFLTPAGKEIAQYMDEVIPRFFNLILSTKMVSIVTIIVHILLSIVKLSVGLLSRSAGLIADGIDNTVDTLSSILVWFGIRHKKEKTVSLFLMMMMVLSVAGITVTSIGKIMHPSPVNEGFIAFITSAAVGLVMLLLSSYQYMTGKKRSNFAILCQSVDARNHFFTSLFVCAGIITSYMASVLGQPWLYYSDAAVALVVGIMIVRGLLNLVREFRKPGDEKTEITHFIEKARQNMRAKIVLQWLAQELKAGSMNYNELADRFHKQFCEQTPKIYMLTGIGYLPASGGEIRYFLDRFVEKKKIVFSRNKYSLPS